MPNVRWSRAIDVPSGELHTIVASLAELACRECPRVTEEIDYSAGIEVFDTDTGAVVVWTATFPVATTDEDDMRATGSAVFRDFIEQLRRELPTASVTVG